MSNKYNYSGLVIITLLLTKFNKEIESCIETLKTVINHGFYVLKCVYNMICQNTFLVRQ